MTTALPKSRRREAISHRHNLLKGLEMSRQSNWIQLMALHSTEDSINSIGQAGLWKPFDDSTQPRRVLDLPISQIEAIAADAFDDEIPTDSALDQVLQWAIDTFDADSSQFANPHSRAEIESMLRPGALTFQSGPFAVQGRLLCDSDRLAIRFPILPSIPAGLSEPRLSHLNQLAMEASRQFRMARAGLLGEGPNRSLVAEVDLTGAPAAVVEVLLSIGVESVRAMTAWLIAPAALVIDTTVCRSLDLPFPQRADQPGKEMSP